MTKEERENAIRCLKKWIEREPYIQTYKTCLEALEHEPMRDATPEERESVDAYIRSISKPTGIEFDEEQEQLDFVQPHKSIPVKLKVKEPSGDAVSRQAVIERLKKEDKILYTTTGLNYLIRAIKELPSVKPQEPTGHWILLDECSNSGYYCSECHKKVVKEGWSNTVKKIKYCPNCGADMGGEQHDGM